MAHPLSARATVLLRPDLRLLLLAETAKKEEPSGPELLVLLVGANSKALLAPLRLISLRSADAID